MNETNGGGCATSLTRRRGLAHCTAVVLAALGGGALSSPLRAAAPTTPAAPSTALRILVVGDSLSAEYGLQRGSGWVALLQKRLAAERIDASLVNASISGDTTSGGRSRLDPLLREHRPSLVVIELGGNDALRGLPLEGIRSNLTAMVRASRQVGARVLLLGMQIPPNYGRDYSERFAEVYTQVARDERAALVPFMLKGVADVADPVRMFQPDRIHPVAAAHPVILNNVWPVLEPLLKQPVRVGAE